MVSAVKTRVPTSDVSESRGSSRRITSGSFPLPRAPRSASTAFLTGLGCAVIAAFSGCASESTDDDNGSAPVTTTTDGMPTDSTVPDPTAPTTTPTGDATQPQQPTTPVPTATTPTPGTTTSNPTSTSPPTPPTPTQPGTSPTDGSGGQTNPAAGGSDGSAGTNSAGSGGDPGAGGSGGGAGGMEGTPPVDEFATCPYEPEALPANFPQGWTSGDVTVFNNNGGWTWYNDERVVVDAEAGKIILSSAASTANSETANTNIDAVIHDLATGMNQKTALGSLTYSDDHNNGGILIKAPGEYFVAWAHHNVDCNTYWRNYSNGTWAPTVTHQWSAQGCSTNPKANTITYNNPYELSAEGRYYNIIRSVQTSPNFLLSEDGGRTWNYGGRLTASPQQGYNAGYYKFWGNGVDRIDFFATEAHPRDANTSVYHGYVKGGKSYDSFDKEIDGNVFDTSAPQITEFTRVFGAGSRVGNVTLRRLWNFDIARYDDGTIGVLWQGRENECADKNNCNPGHHVAYSRFDGTEWKSTYLVRGGRTLYRGRGSNDWWEEDYLGGAALDPDDPHVVYVSTNIDPRDNSTTHTNNEIWKGVSCDDGATFQWTPVTMNSPNENLRPAVPKWDRRNTALLWFRGNYQTAQRYNAEVVGILTRN